MHGLRHLRVVDFSIEVAGPYCTKLFADAGADVIKVETPEGDPMRRWSATGADLKGEDSALFRFLNASKRAVLGTLDDVEILELVAGADLVVESFAPNAIDRHELIGRFPGLTWLTITPFGLEGPYANRPVTEFTIQAECGSIGLRGLPGQEPFQAGGRITEWVGGTYAAVGALAAVWRARRTGLGEHMDFSLLEVMNIVATNYMDLFHSLLGRPESTAFMRTLETPSIEPTSDGYVGFCTNSNQQFQDFLVLIERPDLQEDKELAQLAGRLARFNEWNELVHKWTTEHTTQEIVERASRLRIPVAPVLNGKTVLQHEQLVARGVFIDDPTGSFKQPRPPYIINGEEPPPPRPAPKLGQNTGRIESHKLPTGAKVDAPGLPLEGLRIIDMTVWLAGPTASHMFASLGADVIHVESIQRPDGMRFTGGLFMGSEERWWEYGFIFLAANTNKRGITLDLTHPKGHEIIKRLIATSDVVIENFTPRVMESFGLNWQTIHSVNPRAIMVRMPAFGLTGPWRDNPGFAQTMEQITGMAWLTGHRQDQPRIQRGPCDPLAGVHAAFALLLALEERERTGKGQQVEATMVESALNAAAEQVIEFTAYGNLMHRNGNRSPEAAPQGLYACRGQEQWLALSVATQTQWEALKRFLGNPDWANDPSLEHLSGRRTAHDAIDEKLNPFFAKRELHKTIEELISAGIPAAPVVDPALTHQHPQLKARGFYELVEHPIVGVHPMPGLPFRYASADSWIYRPAPALGEHNLEILQGILGMSKEEIDQLIRDEVIGDRPKGV
jgi:crotonobetainyl-CoA:carnitine CoA-transferase CaiB-like acyl-CoA transferase